MAEDIYTVHLSITRQMKEKIADMQIVFPAQYSRIYADLASEKKIELQPDELVANEMLDEKIVRHVILLGHSAEKAIAAIEAEDRRKLQEVLEETKALREEINKLKNMVYEDTLTKTYNRKWFEDMHLSADLAFTKSSGVLVMVDMNNFKEINDSFGHLIGDKVLTYVAAKLKSAGGDVVRYGGDEFIVLFSATVTIAEVEVKMTEVQEAILHSQFKAEGNVFKTGFAFGIAPFNEGHAIASVIDQADSHMYRNKRQRSQM